MSRTAWRTQVSVARRPRSRRVPETARVETSANEHETVGLHVGDNLLSREPNPFDGLERRSPEQVRARCSVETGGSRNLVARGVHRATTPRPKLLPPELQLYVCNVSGGRPAGGTRYRLVGTPTAKRFRERPYSTSHRFAVPRGSRQFLDAGVVCAGARAHSRRSQHHHRRRASRHTRRTGHRAPIPVVRSAPPVTERSITSRTTPVSVIVRCVSAVDL